MTELPKDNLNYPVYVQTEKGSGSGFLLCWQSKKLYLITAKHVLYENDSEKVSRLITKKAKFTIKNENNVLSYEIDDISILPILSNDKDDIVLVEFLDVEIIDGQTRLKPKQGVTRVGSNDFIITFITENHIQKYDDILVSNDVFVLGFPNSLSNKLRDRKSVV